MATRKEKIRAWLIKRQKIIEELSQRLGVVHDDVNGCWRYFRDDGTWPEIPGEFYLNEDFRSLISECNYYNGALDLCSACGIEY